jgi:co-chaperonin GroES (HSP10)
MKPQIVGHRLLIKTITLEEHDPAFAAAKRLGLKIAEKTERLESTIIESGFVEQIGSTAFKDFGGEAWCKVGDRVDYVRHGGKFVYDPDNKENKWLVINDEDVLVIWRQND